MLPSPHGTGHSGDAYFERVKLGSQKEAGEYRLEFCRAFLDDLDGHF